MWNVVQPEISGNSQATLTEEPSPELVEEEQINVLYLPLVSR